LATGASFDICLGGFTFGARSDCEDDALSAVGDEFDGRFEANA
jgi:hypothetical protein